LKSGSSVGCLVLAIEISLHSLLVGTGTP
jgi:hypothetical protein